MLQELVVDNFAGGGGASTGIEAALGRPVDIAINHDRTAILMHKANHPNTFHYREDVWEVDPVEACKGRSVGLAWFSPDCKHFSKAKGSKPRDNKIRGLAWVAVKWAKAVSPRIIMLENVTEFMEWGPLDADGNQIESEKGKTFRAFVCALRKLGYKVEVKLLSGCDYGAPTIRKRMFIIARRDGQPIVWPEPTHGDPKSKEVRKGLRKPWRTAAECIDWSLPCPSIFERKRPLAEKTLRRIAQGIQKYVIDAEQPFIVLCNHSGKSFRGQGIEEPFKTLTASRDAYGLIDLKLTHAADVAHLIRHFGNSTGSPPDEPVGTVTAGWRRQNRYRNFAFD
jgi:DNA (cytosine-5)-methyltransferase 1